MTLLSRAPVAGFRSGVSARSQLFRFKLPQHSFRRNTSTEAAQSGSSSRPRSRLNAIGNVMLGSTLIGAGAATTYLTYLRFNNSGMGLGVAANTIMDEGLHPAHYPWPNDHPFATFDHSRYINFRRTTIDLTLQFAAGISGLS
jgi:hypothetical protein